ncbi:MAG: oxygen-independent coproporphyrinogen III oxidase [Oligoflexia bacterium]|nr:oxygen-independent coproporphyrinogen III oxidase [Oligoflexia bacterium]
MSRLTELISKYDVSIPRYTSYPTVPYWEDNLTTDTWIDQLRMACHLNQASLAFYVHVPFCESLCTFCGCNSSITKDHSKEAPYVDLVLREFEAYLKMVPELKNIPALELHLGGGTPTFLSSGELRRLTKGILGSNPAWSPECSIEIDPRRVKREQLETLRELGYERVSLGVQDFNPEVQRLINRIQPFEVTRDVTHWARELGFKSVNFDLIFGLPKQTAELMLDSARKTIELRPDRIALYSYAHVPWIKPAQRLFTEDDLPKGAEKRRLYELARVELLNSGYQEIGLDHFALPTDSLSQSASKGQLHRNFMGYTHRRTNILLGLGVSAISETPTAFHQNQKVLQLYERDIGEQKIPTLRGHLLTDEDRRAREQILNLITKMRTSISPTDRSSVATMLKPMIDDGLAQLTETEVLIEEQGRPFLRNACVAFDRRLQNKQPETRIFSQSV